MRSGEELARRLGAREIRPDVSFAEKRLLNIVQEMAVAAHMPRPQVMLQPRVKAINAFATGWNQADWVIVVTEGALDWLTREELQALLQAVLDGGLASIVPGAVFATVRHLPGVHAAPLVEPVVHSEVAFIYQQAQAAMPALQAALVLMALPAWQALCLRHAGALQNF